MPGALRNTSERVRQPWFLMSLAVKTVTPAGARRMDCSYLEAPDTDSTGSSMSCSSEMSARVSACEAGEEGGGTMAGSAGVSKAASRVARAEAEGIMGGCDRLGARDTRYAGRRGAHEVTRRWRGCRAGMDLGDAKIRDGNLSRRGLWHGRAHKKAAPGRARRGDAEAGGV